MSRKISPEEKRKSRNVSLDDATWERLEKIAQANLGSSNVSQAITFLSLHATKERKERR